MSPAGIGEAPISYQKSREKSQGGLNATGRPLGGVDMGVFVDEANFYWALSKAETMQPRLVQADSMQLDDMTK